MAYKDIEKRRETQRRYYQNHKAEYAKSKRQYRQRIKLEVLDHYSLLKGMSNPDDSKINTPCCGCCQESDLSKLNIDHIRGGGRAHRKSLGFTDSYQFYIWLKKQGYPEGYQTLCSAHNLRKEHYWEKENNGIPKKSVAQLSAMKLRSSL